jgi:hypothetical protein
MLQLWPKEPKSFIYTTSQTKSILDYKLDGSSGLKPKMANLYSGIIKKEATQMVEDRVIKLG